MLPAMHEPSFVWPPGFEPEHARLYLRNARDLEASLGAVWAALVAAPAWPNWYPNARAVKLPPGQTTLSEGTRFTWMQTGVALESVVVEFVPERRLAWSARSPFIQAYHTWDLAPSEKGCSVVTDETQRGMMPTLLGPFLRPKMLAVHDLWLEKLEERARA